MNNRPLYQLEVKVNVVRILFHPNAGWRVTVDVDPMERARGRQQPQGKAERVDRAFEALQALGVALGPHDVFGRIDIVADHPDQGLRLIEAEGESRKQREQALYSAIGQLALGMRFFGDHIRYGVAVPDTRQWRRQLAKIPRTLRKRLNLDLYSVRDGSVTVHDPETELAPLGRG